MITKILAKVSLLRKVDLGYVGVVIVLFGVYSNVQTFITTASKHPHITDADHYLIDLIMTQIALAVWIGLSVTMQRTGRSQRDTLVKLLDSNSQVMSKMQQDKIQDLNVIQTLTVQLQQALGKPVTKTPEGPNLKDYLKNTRLTRK